MEFKFECNETMVYRIDEHGCRQFVCECRNEYYSKIILLLLGLTATDIIQAIAACTDARRFEVLPKLTDIGAAMGNKNFEFEPRVHGLDVDNNHKIRLVIDQLKKIYVAEHAEDKVDGTEFDVKMLRGLDRVIEQFYKK